MRTNTVLGLVLGVAALWLPVAAQAVTPGAVISNGTVMLGVTQLGDLNYNCVAASDPVCPGNSVGSVNFGGNPKVGIRFVPLNTDATADGCACEGWARQTRRAGSRATPTTVCGLLATHSGARTSTASLGAADPRARNDTDGGRARNRRVEVHISY